MLRAVWDHFQALEYSLCTEFLTLAPFDGLIISLSASRILRCSTCQHLPGSGAIWFVEKTVKQTHFLQFFWLWRILLGMPERFDVK